MEIIKAGDINKTKSFKLICKECGCKFTFNLADVINLPKIEGFYNICDEIIKCPNCGKEYGIIITKQGERILETEFNTVQYVDTHLEDMITSFDKKLLYFYYKYGTKEVIDFILQPDTQQRIINAKNKISDPFYDYQWKQFLNLLERRGKQFLNLLESQGGKAIYDSQWKQFWEQFLKWKQFLNRLKSGRCSNIFFKR